MSISKDPKHVDKKSSKDTKPVMETKGNLPLEGFALNPVYSNTETIELKQVIHDIYEAVFQQSLTVGQFPVPTSDEFTDKFKQLAIQNGYKFNDNWGLIEGYTTNYISPASVLKPIDKDLAYRTNRQKLSSYVEKSLEHLLVEINSNDDGTYRDQITMTLGYCDLNGNTVMADATIEKRVYLFLTGMSKLCTNSNLDNRYLHMKELFEQAMFVFTNLAKEGGVITFATLKNWFTLMRKSYEDKIRDTYSKLYGRYNLTVNEVLPLKRTVSWKSYKEPQVIREATFNRDSLVNQLLEEIYVVKLLEAL